jgi:hypothetical protein
LAELKISPEFCTIDLTKGGYHLGTLAIMEVTKPTHNSRRYPDGKIQEIKFAEKSGVKSALGSLRIGMSQGQA